MNDPIQCSIYQLRAVLNGVSPLVWRRFLLSSETSLADLHKMWAFDLQVAEAVCSLI
jgi:pRiA4b ORF-3-like protein